jgi:hypothetical protein
LMFSARIDCDPEAWPDDGGVKRVPIYNHHYNPPILIRKVGWVNCLGRFSVSAPHRILSPDVTKVRMCDRCKKADYGVGITE